MRAADIADWIANLVPHREMSPDEGFKWGDPACEVTGVLISWMGTLDAISRAADEGCNLMVVHEELTYPYGHLDPNLHSRLAWRSNHARLSALARGGITVFRAHGHLDSYCILDDFGFQLGLTTPSVSEQYYRIYDIPPVTVGRLAEAVKQAAGMPAVRVCGDVGGTVDRIGVLWGGLGLSLNAAFIEGLLQYDPNVFIAGESDEYAMLLARDVGVPLIETSHVVSETAGLARVAREMQARFPELRVVFHDLGCPWQVV